MRDRARASTRGSACSARRSGRDAARNTRHNTVAPRRVASPPRHLVALAGFVAQHVGIFEEAGDLLGGEHIAHEDVAARVEEVAQRFGSLGDVLHRELRGGVESVQVDERGVVYRPAVIHRPERGLPSDESQRVAAHRLDPAAVEQPGRSVEIAREAAATTRRRARSRSWRRSSPSTISIVPSTGT